MERILEESLDLWNCKFCLKTAIGAVYNKQYFDHTTNDLL